MVFKFLGCPFKEKNKYKASTCSFKKNLLILNNVPKAASEFLLKLFPLPSVGFRLCFSAISRLLSSDHTMFRSTGGFLYAILGLKSPLMISEQGY
jgi:hypothetical protein